MKRAVWRHWKARPEQSLFYVSGVEADKLQDNAHIKNAENSSSVRTAFLPKTVALALIETKNRQDEEKMLLGS